MVHPEYSIAGTPRSASRITPSLEIRDSEASKVFREWQCLSPAESLCQENVSALNRRAGEADGSRGDPGRAGRAREKQGRKLMERLIIRQKRACSTYPHWSLPRTHWRLVKSVSYAMFRGACGCDVARGCGGVRSQSRRCRPDGRRAGLDQRGRLDGGRGLVRRQSSGRRARIGGLAGGRRSDRRRCSGRRRRGHERRGRRRGE